MMPRLDVFSRSAALDAAVDELLAQIGITSPPVDAVFVAQALGLSVVHSPCQNARAQYVQLASGALGWEQPATIARRDDPPGSILLRRDPRPERQQWAVAHELGEHLSASLFVKMGIDAAEAALGAREAVANCFASRLLLPAAWLAVDARRCDWDLLQIKRRYGTASHELIARRMLDFESPAIVTVIDHARQTWRRSNAGRRPPPLATWEQQVWQTSHHQATTSEMVRGRFRVRCWPIHEADWKREIIRTEWCDDCDEDFELESFDRD
jgi:Zn-dependent peptidase ImmA (M78 family)